MLTLVAALAADGAIGFQGRLLYWLPDDLRRFKALTTGHIVVMGRRTFESLPKGALPNRRNIVLSRSLAALPGAEVYSSLDGALAACGPDEDVYVIGGASVYAQALPLADRLCLTRVDDTPPSADAFFPPLRAEDWTELPGRWHEADERHARRFRFVDYERRRP